MSSAAFLIKNNSPFQLALKRILFEEGYSIFPERKGGTLYEMDIMKGEIDPLLLELGRITGKIKGLSQEVNSPFIYAGKVGFFADNFHYLREKTEIFQGQEFSESYSFPLEITFFSQPGYCCPICLISYSFLSHFADSSFWPASVGRLVTVDSLKFPFSLFDLFPQPPLLTTLVLGSSDMGEPLILDAHSSFGHRIFLLKELLRISLGEFWIRLQAGLEYSELSADVAVAVPTWISERLRHKVAQVERESSLRHQHFIRARREEEGWISQESTPAGGPLFYTSARGNALPESPDCCSQRALRSSQYLNLHELRKAFNQADFSFYLGEIRKW